jgi:hypothetical protein
MAPAEGVMNPVRSFSSTLIGFAAVVIVAAVALAIRDAGSFHRGGEFDSAWQRAEFDLLAWGIVLVFSGGAFALVTVLLIPSGRVLPLPLLVGLVCGAAVVAVFGFGFANHLQRSAGIPWPLIAVAPGVAAGGGVVALALVTNRLITWNMIRIQIRLTEEQATRLREVAGAQGRSMTDLIRQSIDSWLDSSPATRDRSALREAAIAMAGRHRSRLGDLAKRHDHYLERDLMR